MEAGLHRFIRLLRQFGLSVSVSEAADAMRAAALPGMLADPGRLREALAVTLVKDRRDEELFEELFSAFFYLRPVPSRATEHGHEHEDLTDSGDLTSFTFSDEPAANPRQGHSHGKPERIADYFDRKDLAQRFNLHQEANRIDLAALTDQIVLASRGGAAAGAVSPVRLEADRLHGAGLPGQLAPETGLRVDTELTVAGRDAGGRAAALDEELDAALRGQLAGIIGELPELLKRHLDRLAELESVAIESHAAGRERAEAIDEGDRARLEEALRRIGRSLPGALTSRKRATPRGRVHPGRTMRANMRYDGVPFRPVTVARSEDRPRLVVLADVSLSVRRTSRFTLHLVHGLQSLFAQVRSFVFVAEPLEITELFAEYPLERALGLVFDGLPAGGLLDVAANSDYGRAFEHLLAEHPAALDRHATLLVLGDGRGNGNDPRPEVFAEIARRVRRVIWLTPEPRYSWRLGSCDLPRYAEYCDQVRVVADLAGLERGSHQMSGAR